MGARVPRCFATSSSRRGSAPGQGEVELEEAPSLLQPRLCSVRTTVPATREPPPRGRAELTKCRAACGGGIALQGSGHVPALPFGPVGVAWGTCLLGNRRSARLPLLGSPSAHTGLSCTDRPPERPQSPKLIRQTLSGLFYHPTVSRVISKSLFRVADLLDVNL